MGCPSFLFYFNIIKPLLWHYAFQISGSQLKIRKQPFQIVSLVPWVFKPLIFNAGAFCAKALMPEIGKFNLSTVPKFSCSMKKKSCNTSLGFNPSVLRLFLKRLLLCHLVARFPCLADQWLSDQAPVGLLLLTFWLNLDTGPFFWNGADRSAIAFAM